MAAGFEGDVHCSAFGIIAVFFAIAEGINFSVRAGEFFVPSFADDIVTFYYDATNGGVGLN
jgi:hypothetical protein